MRILVFRYVSNRCTVFHNYFIFLRVFTFLESVYVIDASGVVYHFANKYSRNFRPSMCVCLKKNLRTNLRQTGDSPERGSTTSMAFKRPMIRTKSTTLSVPENVDDGNAYARNGRQRRLKYTHAYTYIR